MKRQSRDKIVIGLTGAPGTGKSTVARMFKDKGAAVIDADRIGHELIEPGTPGYRAVVRAFGAGILDTGGRIDRRVLGKIIFAAPRRRKELNAILHPRIIRRIKEEAGTARERVVVIDAPLLFEAGLETTVDTVVVVTASRSSQLRRLKARTGLSRAELLSRIASQLSQREKVQKADYVIDNSTTMKETKAQVESIRRVIWKS